MFNLSHLSVHNSDGEREIIIQKYSRAKVDEPLWTVWEYKLQQIYYSERITLLCIFCIVTFVAIVGNLLTLYVVLTRKHRLLFKTCLLSLALSDLIYATSCGVNHISKLIFNSSSLWYLGSFGCTFIPFLQTSSLLSGSMSLVSIAADRYMAVFNKRKGQWQPGLLFCITGFVIIWSISTGISSPNLFSYELVNAYIVPQIQENYYIAQFCLLSRDDKDESLYYYCIIFIFVFLPLFVTFIAFNAIIAREIWKRRKAPGSRSHHATRDECERRKNNEDSSSGTMAEVKTSNDTNMTSVRNNNGSKDASADNHHQQQQIFTISVHQEQQQPQQQQNNDRCNERQRRQIRMFTVILILMCVFILFRIPTWIFLLYKLNFSVEARIQWLLNYIFSVIGIMNSMANPFLYTFLSHTIRFTSCVQNVCYKFCKLCRVKETTPANYSNNQTMFAKNDDALNKRKSDNGGVYLGN